MAAVRFEDLAAGPSDRFLSRSMNDLSNVALDMRKQPTLADLGVASKSSRSPPPAAAPAAEATSSAASGEATSSGESEATSSGESDTRRRLSQGRTRYA